ncbi:MAG: hypothetical protein E7459_04210 [Ruminococcaceae bacterium]|nr:hypothetical protein [Oscillospiraceae bacterium]
MFKRIGAALRQFLSGRYGMDQLNMLLLYVNLFLAIVVLFTGSLWLNLLTYIPLGIIVFRMLSKNIPARHEENRRYLQLRDRLKDRYNRYFRCPKCKQMVRVPKGKGKIAITCPRCKERFVKKT